MKGLNLAEDTGWTLIVLLVFVVMAIIGILLYIQTFFSFSSSPIAYSVEFVQIYSKPFMLAEVLTQAKFGDRHLLEQAIEISAANSVQGANADNLPPGLASFVDSYNFKNYYISVNREGKEIINVESTRFKCGDNLEGWCVIPVINFGCDVGRVEISQSKNQCVSAVQVCCKEDRQEYARTIGARRGIAVVSCGNNGIGVCSEGVQPWTVFSTADTCTQNRITLGNPPECSTVNNGKTPVCCAPLTEETSIATGLTTNAIVPLLYKQTLGTLEVTAK